MSYDPAQFYNAALAIVGGSGAATLSFRLIPPLSPAFRTRRLLMLTRQDLRRLITRPARWAVGDWETAGYGRLAVFPDGPLRLQRSHLLAAILVGAEITRLRRVAHRLGLTTGLDAALAALCLGDVATAVARFAALDALLTARATPSVLRARARILAISGTLTQHAAYFEGAAA